MHPVEIVFQRMTSIVSPAMPEPVEIDADCDYCERSPDEFGYRGYHFESYGKTSPCCHACYSFLIGDIDITGVEYTRKRGAKTPQKFGMWPGVSAAIEVSGNRSVLLAPKGVYDKLPQTFLDSIETYEMKKSSRIQWVIEHLSFPLIYISEFGKSTNALISNLRISESVSDILCSSDKGIQQVNAQACINVFNHLSGLSNKEAELFFNTVRWLAKGTMSPRKANVVWSENPCLANAARALPIDPHQRLSLISIVQEMRG